MKQKTISVDISLLKGIQTTLKRFADDLEDDEALSSWASVTDLLEFNGGYIHEDPDLEIPDHVIERLRRKVEDVFGKPDKETSYSNEGIQEGVMFE
jgi:hypothetical protein